MPSFKQMAGAASAVAAVTRSSSSSLSDLCTVSNVQDILPSNGTLLGIHVLADSVTASVANVSSSSGSMGGMRRRQTSSSSSSSSSSDTQYCNVTLQYTHPGKDDVVNIKYAFPDPDDFSQRFYVAGGGGYQLVSDATGGLDYGAASGATDAGYDGFNYSLDEVILKGNGSVWWDAAYMFGYQALGEMTKLGKYLTPKFYSMSDDDKLYTYFSGCSDGGREAMSQVQRWGQEYDGVVAGAPAFRYAQQQVHHIHPAVVEVTYDHYPPPCAFDKIVNATIAACDPLDGRTDGVIGRTDLCMLNFNLTSLIGESYYCAAETSSSLGFGYSKRQAEGSQSSSTPEQNGTLSEMDIKVAQAIYDGVFTNDGTRAYLSWQIGSGLDDGDTTYNNETDSWEVNIVSTGGEYITKFVQLLDLDNLESLDGVDYDTVVYWMEVAFARYYDSLQTTWPDLRPFKDTGGKLIHYHGESDPSVPSASSAHYWQSVRNTLYNHLSDDEAVEAMKEWYQFYLVPGAAHCGANSLQPGPYPEADSLMDTIIAWVENGTQPDALNATVSSGDYEGETQMLCQWPTRPLWSSNSTFDCVTDEKSIETWTYDFAAFKQAVY